MTDSRRENAGPGARSSVRPEHELAAPLLTFDLREEFERLRAEPTYAEHRRNAKTLVKSEAFRLVAVALRAGIQFDEASPRGHVGLLVHEGAVSLHVAEQALRLEAGQVAAIEPGNAWSAEAEEDSLLFLSLTWPG